MLYVNGRWSYGNAKNMFLIMEFAVRYIKKIFLATVVDNSPLLNDVTATTIA